MQLASAFRHSDNIVAILNVDDGTFVDVNPAFARVLGWTSAEAIGRRTVDINLWPDLEVRASIWAQLRAQAGVRDMALRFRTKSGEILWGRLDCELMDGERGVVVFCLLRDFRPSIEDPISPRENRESYRALFQAAAEGIYRSLPNGTFIDVNPALATMFGYASPADMLLNLKRPVLELYVDPAHGRWVSQQLDSVGRIDQVNSEVFRCDGSRIWIAENARAVRDEVGQLLFYEGTTVDITERIAAEAALQQSQALYKVLVDNCRDGVFLIQRGRVVFANRALAQMLGYSEAELIGQAYMDLVTPEDRAAQATRRGERESGSKSVQRYEIHMLRRDGQRVLCAVHADAVQYLGDIASSGLIRDITEERRMEAALLRSESKYRTLVEHSQVGVFISRGDRYTYVNQRLCDMLGYNEDELLRVALRDLVAPEYLPASEERLQRLQAGEEVALDFENCYLCKDSSRIYVTVSIGRIDIDGESHLTGTVRDVTRHREAEHRLRFHATHDSLTGLPNRMLFQTRLDEALRAARASGDHSYAVLFLDLDGFKLVNDSLGHAAGDRLLVVIGELLTRTLSEDALVARYGGDEFTILPHGHCDQARAVALAGRVLDLFAAPFDIDSHQAFSGASLGIVLGHEDYSKPDQVLRDADTAMYRAKAGGKSGYVIFDEAMHEAAKLRFQIETDFRLAFEREEFRVYYQPVVSLHGGAILAFEALVRWQHPQRGLVPPSEFLHVAEESGLIATLDWWVLEHACRQVAAWQRRHPAYAGIRINANVDERQVASLDVVTRMRDVLDRSGIAPSCVTLEITETVFRSGRGPATPMLASLKALGVGLAVDDFGTGYSSLDSFASAPFDTLKIDQSFIRDMETNVRHRAIVRTISGFAEDLGLSLTAEGVETAGQARLLAAMGCQSAQGYLYAPALPADQVEILLSSGFPLPRVAAFG